MLDKQKKAKYSLLKVKELIVFGRVDFLGKRPKNRETLKRLGLNVDDALKQIRKLNTYDFVGVDKEVGKVEADVYLKTISGIDVYIKFRIESPRLVVISFHENETGGKP